MAMCPKCGTDNDNTRLTCFRCGMVLPKLSLEELESKSEVNVVIDENLETKDVVKASDCIFLSSLKEIKDLVDSGQWEVEDIQNKLDAVKKESNYILDLINSFSDEEKSWMTTGLSKIDTSYDKFQESFGKFDQFLNTQDASLLEDGMKVATEASHMLLEGINEAQDELGVEEEKISEELGNVEGLDLDEDFDLDEDEDFDLDDMDFDSDESMEEEEAEEEYK
ncbi:MAG: hypothetical protein ABIH00_09975 [Armatimonadota bacterium]